MTVKQMLKALFIGAALLVISAQPAAAQSNVSGGFAVVNWNGCCAYGFAVDFAHQVHATNNMALSVVGDFGWTRFSDEESDTTYVGGLRATFLKDTRVPVHAQVTFGGVHWSEDSFEGAPAFTGNDFIIGVGFGTIIKMTDMIGVKPQVDWFFLPGEESDHFFRFSINAVIPIGKK
jgi:hypothetical protein